MGGLSWAMLRRHLASYAGAFAAMVLAAALMGGSVNLATSAALLHGIDVDALGLERRAEAQLWGTFMGVMGGLTAFVAIVVSVVLIASLISFVVAGRRRELALLRLSGARPGQLVRMVVGEVAALSLAAGLVGGLLSQPVGSGYLALFAATYGKPDGARVEWLVEPIIVGLVLTVLVAVLSALGPARKVGRVAPIEALQEGSARRKPMTIGRWIAGVLAFGGAAAMMLIPADLDPSLFTMLVMVQGLLAVLGLVQLAPVVVAPISRLVTGLTARFTPGPGTLAQGHASWNAARTASLANPALLLVAVPAVFLTMSFGLTEGFSQLELRTLKADAVATATAGGTEATPDAVEAVEGVDVAARGFMSQGAYYNSDGPVVETFQLHLVDFEPLARVVELDVREGSLDAVRGDRVAISEASAREIGDTFTLKPADGDPFPVTVVARVGNVPSARELLVDAATFDRRGVGMEHQIWFLGLADGVTAADASAAVAQAIAPADPASVAVQTAEGYTETLATESNQQVTTSVMVLVGGACLLAALAIGVAVMTSLRERRGEFALARRAGAQESGIHASTLVETVAILVVAYAFALAVVGVVWLRVLQNFAAFDLAGLPPVPWGILGAFAGVGVLIALVSTVLGTWATLRATRME